MVDSDDFTRRRLLQTTVATGLAAGGLTGQAAGLLRVNVDTSAGGAEAEVERSGTDVDVETDADLDAERVPPLDVDGPIEPVAPTAVPETAAGIRPGSQILVQRDGSTAGCSANFVWRDAADGSLYLGAAGHCFLQDAPAAAEFAEGEGDDVDDLTVMVATDGTFGGAAGMTVGDARPVELGDVVYARQEEPGGGEGVGHDFGLVEIPSDVEHLVDPSMPQFGGPDGTVDGVVPDGDPVVQYGAGVANGETYVTQGSRGLSLGAGPNEGSWTAGIRASPGDSGSALSAATDVTSYRGGAAAGALTHLTSSGTAGTTVDRCLEMVAEDGLDLDLEVVQP